MYVVSCNTFVSCPNYLTLFQSLFQAVVHLLQQYFTSAQLTCHLGVSLYWINSVSFQPRYPFTAAFRASQPALSHLPPSDTIVFFLRQWGNPSVHFGYDGDQDHCNVYIHPLTHSSSLEADIPLGIRLGCGGREGLAGLGVFLPQVSLAALRVFLYPHISLSVPNTLL